MPRPSLQALLGEAKEASTAVCVAAVDCGKTWGVKHCALAAAGADVSTQSCMKL